MTEAFAGLDRTAELLSWPAEDDDPRRTETMPSVEGHLVFEDVSFAYDEDKPVLRDINFDAEPGTVIAPRRQFGLRKVYPGGIGRDLPDARLRQGPHGRRRPGYREVVELPVTTRPGAAGRLPLRRHDPREPAFRATRCHGHPAAGCGRAGLRHRVHRSVPGWLGHGDR